MPIDKRRTTEEIIRELMEAYEETGKIGDITPSSKEEARKIAVAIALRTKGVSKK